ncbi:MAG: hypothetical protein M1609_07600 [Firmicutes bacterium]|nr:hypothetical protein [Bacillota bacterium]
MTPELRVRLFKDLIQVDKVKEWPEFEIRFTETSGTGHHLSLVVSCCEQDLRKIKREIEKVLSNGEAG